MYCRYQSGTPPNCRSECLVVLRCQSPRLIHVAALLQFVGMVNIYDIVTAVCFKNAFNFKEDLLSHLSDSDFQKMENLEVLSQPLTSCLGLSDESKNFVNLKSSDNLSCALQLFSLGMHRILVQFPDRSLLTQDAHSPTGYARILSQTDVVRFIHMNANSPDILPTLNRTLVESGLVASFAPSKQNVAVLSICIDVVRCVSMD